MRSSLLYPAISPEYTQEAGVESLVYHRGAKLLTEVPPSVPQNLCVRLNLSHKIHGLCKIRSASFVKIGTSSSYVSFHEEHHERFLPLNRRLRASGSRWCVIMMQSGR